MFMGNEVWGEFDAMHSKEAQKAANFYAIT